MEVDKKGSKMIDDDDKASGSNTKATKMTISNWKNLTDQITLVCGSVR